MRLIKYTDSKNVAGNKYTGMMQMSHVRLSLLRHNFKFFEAETLVMKHEPM